MKITSTALVIVAALATPAGAFNIPRPVLESSYLEQMSGGGAATMKKPSYGPSKGKPQAPKGGVPGNYLESVQSTTSATPYSAPAPAAAAPAAPAPAARAPAASGSAPATSVDYLKNLKSSSSASGSGLTGYLDALPTRSEAAGSGLASYTSSLAVNSAGAGSGFKGYLDAVGGGGSKLKSSTYAPTKGSVSSGGSRPSYSSSAPSSSSGGGSNAVLDAIGRMTNNMNRNQEKTISVLKDINTGVKTLVTKSDQKVGGAPAGTPWQ